MIDIIKIANGLPISVIVPLQEKRKWFFYQFVMPLLVANSPAEIIINTNEGGAAKKRNEGFRVSTCPFVLFSDDDILFPKDYFKTLYADISDSECGYVYTGYDGIILNSATNEAKNNFSIDTIDFDPDIFKEKNFISTMSLMKRELFPYFDETISRLLDYDLYLNMLSKGIRGKAVHGIKFYAFYLDDGITSIKNELNYIKIRNKYSDLFEGEVE